MTDLAEQINQAINTALEAENAAQPPRTYLGASEIGRQCERALAFKWHGHKGEPFPGRAIRRFRLGHIHEDETADWLRKAGFDLQGSQLHFSLADGKFAGHVDGIITGGPVAMPYPVLWEHKIMKASIWRETSRSKVETAKPEYFAQAQIYMRQFSLGHALFTALNTDTSELLFEMIPYDAAKADTYIDRARRILTSQSPEELPRAGNNEYAFACKFCGYKEVCWSAPKAATPAVAAPSWLKRA